MAKKTSVRGPLEIRLVNQKNNVKSPCIAGTTWPNVQPVANLWSMLTATRCQEQRENAMMLTRTVENILHIGIFECTMAIAMQLFLCKHCHIFLLLPEALVFPLQEPWNYRTLGFTPGNKIQQICLHCMHQFCESHRQEFFCALGQDFLSQHLQQGPQGRAGLGIHVYKYSMWLKGPLSNSSAWNESFFGSEKKRRRKKVIYSPIFPSTSSNWRVEGSNMYSLQRPFSFSKCCSERSK